MPYSAILRNSLIGIFVIIGLFFYKFCATQFNLPSFLAPQWYTLTATIITLVSVAAWLSLPLHIGLLIFESSDNDCKVMRVAIYNALGNKTVSVIWQTICFIMVGILFQYSYYMESLGLLGIGINIMMFRILHNDIIRNAKVQMLNQ